MKKTLFLAFMFGLLVNTQANNNTKIVDSKIKDVTVYRQQAKVSNEATVNLNAGTTEIVFKDISTQINPNSIQVAVKGDITLLAARYETNYLTKNEMPPRIKIVYDSLEILSDKVAWNNQLLNLYTDEESILEANKSLSNEKLNFTAADVKALADMYRARKLELHEKAFSIAKQQKKMNEIIQNLQAQLNEWNANNNQSSGQIILSVSTNASLSGAIKCTYIVNNAGWTPIYDLRSEGWGKPIDLIYKANIYQNTGYSWEDVNLTVCTGNPTLNNNRPILNPIYINFITYDITQLRTKSLDYKTYAGAPSSVNMAMYDKEDDAKFEETKSLEGTTTENILNEEFKLKQVQTIESDGKFHLVNMNSYSLQAIYEYQTIPKLDQAAFLLAKVTDYGKYNLIPGDANIFLEGSYIGQSVINPFTMGDTMLLSLGRDEGITVKRTKLLEFCKTKWIDTKKSETFAYEISIKNNKSSDITIDVLDQIPISKTDDIKVEIDEMSGALYNQEIGKLNWKLTIPANTTKKVKLIYTLKYPKDKSVIETNN
ncbi:MAG: DUF4139 domain-containing protein [Bacteroidota bacterium]